MPRKIDPRPCACGCGRLTKGGIFCPGHDGDVMRAIHEALGGAGTVALRKIVEEHLGHKLKIENRNP